MLTDFKPGVKNILENNNTVQTNVKKSCTELNKCEIKKGFFKKLYNIYNVLTA